VKNEVLLAWLRDLIVAVAEATGEVMGWHTSRHSLATDLRSLGVDVKVAQERLTVANSRTTMDIYTHAVLAQKHEAKAGLLSRFRRKQLRALNLSTLHNLRDLSVQLQGLCF
jgi:integrase